MFAKIVSEDLVLVSEIVPETIAHLKKDLGFVPENVTALKASLDQAAAQLARFKTVRRLPMPIPYRGGFRNYVNSILVNGTAVVPRYRRFGWGYEEYPDQPLAEYYER